MVPVIPEKEDLDLVADRVWRRVHSLSYFPSGEHLTNLRKRHSQVRVILKTKAAIQRLRTEREEYCDCSESCRAAFREEVAVIDSKLALQYRDFRRAIDEFRYDIAFALEEVDKLVADLKMRDLVALCPDQ